MFGKANRAGTPYYVCQRSLNRGKDAKRRFPNHPATIWVREDRMLEGILGFFDERVFGSRRRDLIEQDIQSFKCEPELKRQRQMQSLRRAVEKLDLAQTRLIRKLETDDDVEGILFRRVRERLSELEEERIRQLGELQNLEAEQFETGPEPFDLLEELRVGRACLRPLQTRPPAALPDLPAPGPLRQAFASSDLPRHYR